MRFRFPSSSLFFPPFFRCCFFNSVLLYSCQTVVSFIMANFFAKVIANVVIAGATAFGRTVVQAYRQTIRGMGTCVVSY
jgi:hypothetical protein